MTSDTTMNECEDYRKVLAEDPAFEARLRQAMELPVPELELPELPEVDTNNVVPLPARRRATTWLAMAATVAIVGVLGVRMFSGDVVYDSLADEIVAHLDHEPGALRVTDEPISDRRLRRVVADDVASFDRTASLITYANTCTINGKAVPHLVIQGERGPVTIILMPDEKISGAQSIAGDNINGVLLPVGDGSIAIIGEQGERLDELEQQVLDSVMWST